jgi:type III secretion protein J
MVGGLSRAAALVATVISCACSVPVATQLEESDANRVLVALAGKGVAAEKEPDAEREGAWRVNVPREDAAAAVAVLAHESLPRKASPGLLDAMGSDSIVPSRVSEHARLIAGTAGELERSLLALDGVIAARVHVALPQRDGLVAAETAPPVTASVLLRHRGAMPPLSLADVQRLVAGAVPGLQPELVSVVTTRAIAGNPSRDGELTRFGPLTVARSSMTPLRLMVGGVATLNIILVGVLLTVWSRMRQAEHAIDQATNADPAQARR